jgi:hypothetical protein
MGSLTNFAAFSMNTPPVIQNIWKNRKNINFKQNNIFLDCKKHDNGSIFTIKIICNLTEQERLGKAGSELKKAIVNELYSVKGEVYPDVFGNVLKYESNGFVYQESTDGRTLRIEGQIDPLTIGKNPSCGQALKPTLSRRNSAQTTSVKKPRSTSFLTFIRSFKNKG